MKRYVYTLETGLLVILLGVMGLVLLLQVIFRYFLHTPLLWSEELARYLQVWITFGGIGFGIRHKSHVAMSLLKNRLPSSVQHLLGMVANTIIITCLILLLPTAWNFTAYQNRILSSTLRLPMSAVASAVLVGSLISILYFTVQIIQFIIALRSISGRKKA